MTADVPSDREPDGPAERGESSLKVLLCDDEHEFVHALADRLELRAIHPAIAYSGEQALEMVAENEPEVLVLDLNLPGIDGMEVLRRITRMKLKCRVIILTGHGSDREEVLAEELGACAYLRKPVDIELLTKTMRTACGGRDRPDRDTAPEAEAG